MSTLTPNADALAGEIHIAVKNRNCKMTDMRNFSNSTGLIVAFIAGDCGPMFST
ncbi:MAG: hypothetical protein ACX94B_08175 [Henriciella sp.]